MISRNALILSASEHIEIIAVKLVDDVRYVRAFIVDGGGNRVRRVDGRDSQLRGRDYKTFVNKNVGAGGMIDDLEIELIVVIRLPQLCGDAQIVITVARYELIAADLVPLFRGFDARGAECVDAQA